MVDRVALGRALFRGLAWIFVAGVLVQALLAGVAVMSDASYWAWHTTFVRALEAVPVLMLVAALLGRSNAALALASGALWFLIGFQYAFAGMRPSLVASLHVLNAFLIFAAGLWLARVPATPGASSWVRPAWRTKDADVAAA